MNFINCLIVSFKNESNFIISNTQVFLKNTFYVLVEAHQLERYIYLYNYLVWKKLRYGVTIHNLPYVHVI